MPLVKKVFWSEEETKCLVAIWGSPEFQEKMENSTRKNGLYVELTEELAKAGFHRTPEQVINKLKKIKKEYRDHKGGFNKPQGRPLYKTAYFGLLDSVMSHRRENQIAGELDSDEVAPTMGAKVDRHMSPAASRDCLDDSFTWDDGVSTDDSQWLDDEVQVLMTLWAQANIQKRLLHTATAHQVFTYLSDELTLVGFNKSPRQCSVKVSNLLEEYKKIKQAGSRENDKSGWFAILDGVLNPEAETLKNSFSAHINRKLPKDDQVNAMPEAAWTSNEVKVLLRRWAEDSIQEQLRSTETTERDHQPMPGKNKGHDTKV
ncbi:zinc finger and SCAN domain-containing protein 29-like [Pholidichthys leucotaenia]